MRRYFYIKEFDLNSIDYGNRVESKQKYEAYVEKAYEDLTAKNTRLDNHTGKVRDNSGVIEQYVDQSDHEPHENIKEVMIEFVAHYIICRASRFYNLDRL